MSGFDHTKERRPGQDGPKQGHKDTRRFCKICRKVPVPRGSSACAACSVVLGQLGEVHTSTGVVRPSPVELPHLLAIYERRASRGRELFRRVGRVLARWLELKGLPTHRQFFGANAGAGVQSENVHKCP